MSVPRYNGSPFERMTTQPSLSSGISGASNHTAPSRSTRRPMRRRSSIVFWK